MRYRGFIETAGAPVSGWAVADGEACELTLVVNNGKPFTFSSNGERPDLLRSGLSTGKGGFSIDLEPHLVLGENFVEIRFPDGAMVSGSPFTRTIATETGDEQPYRGFVEGVEGDRVRGWAVTQDGRPCEVRADISDSIQLTTVSDRPRPDLLRNGISTGLGGFEFAIPAIEGEANTVSIFYRDGTHLPGSPLAIPKTGKAEIASKSQARVAAPQPPETPRATPPRRKADAQEEGRSRSGHEGGRPPRAAYAPRKPVREPGMPSLAELDELSLDDLSLAVASGLVSVASPAQPPTQEALVEAEVPQDAPSFTQVSNETPPRFARLRKWLRV